MGLYVGLDLHSTNCYTGIIDEEGRKRLGQKFANDRSKIVSALLPYREEIVGIAVESTYNWYWLVDALMEEGYPVHLANPAAMKQYEGIKYLNDRHDAFWLANMLKLGILPQGYIYPRETRGVLGVGKVLGMTITLESGSIDRFASYSRCVPSAYWSNAKQKGAGNKKNGNKYLSWAFAEAANFSIRYCSEAEAFYQRKSAKTNPPSAYRAVANKRS
ncbi:MAG: transposase [Candidatus Manganitrophaceae bacterium]